MRLRLPSSRGFFQARLSPVDSLWACLSPALALYLSEAQVLLAGYDTATVALYCSVSAGSALATFLGFRLRDGLNQYFSVTDALRVLRAVLVAELASGALLFTLTRLDGIPRSTPIVHALVLAAGLLAWRLLVRMMHPETKDEQSQAVVERVLVVGATKLAARYIQLLDAVSSHRRQVVAMLDDRPELVGRSMFGIRVVGPARRIESTVEEYAIHGVEIDRVLVGGDPDLLSRETLKEIRRVCERYDIPLEFVPELIGLKKLHLSPVRPLPTPAPPTAPSSYFRIKRAVDLALALALVVFLAPLWMVVFVLAFFDVGTPIFFWQQRMGRYGRPFLLYKVRTLRPPFDGRGRPIPEGNRISVIGSLLRKLRLDEFPQLLNVVVGDMSMIGPRPLLPQDQPDDPTLRLAVRPGITGWAQVNGATSLTAHEKKALDEWYVRNASLGLDWRIVLLTVRFLFTGRDEAKSQHSERLASVQSGAGGRYPPTSPSSVPAE